MIMMLASCHQGSWLIDGACVCVFRYDKLTARELFKMYGVSERLYKEAFEREYYTKNSYPCMQHPDIAHLCMHYRVMSCSRCTASPSGYTRRPSSVSS
jgi:hypothetical protein